MNYHETAVSGNNLTSYTFSSMDIGIANANRNVIVGIVSRGLSSKNISSVTIGGITAIEVITARNTSSNTSISAQYIANVPAGSTGNVVVSFDGQMLRCAVATYSDNNVTVNDSGVDNTDPHQVSLDISAGGAVIGVSGNFDESTIVWTNVILDNTTDIEPTGNYISTASSNFASAQSGLLISADWSSPAVGVFCTASYDITEVIISTENAIFFGNNF